MALKTKFATFVRKIILVGIFFTNTHTSAYSMQNLPLKQELLRIYQEEIHSHHFATKDYIEAMLSHLQYLQYPIENTSDMRNYLLGALIKGAIPIKGTAQLRQSFFTMKIQSFIHKLSPKRLYYSNAEKFVLETLVSFYNDGPFI